MRITLSSRQASVGLYTLFGVLAVSAYGVTSGFPSPLLPGYPGSAMFPRLVLIAMAAICVWGLVGTLLFSPKGLVEDAVTIPLGGFVGIMSMLGAFAVLLTVAGLEVAILATIGVTIWLRTHSMVVAGVSAVSALVAAYIVFVQLLSVPLPLLLLPRYLLRL